MDFAPTDRVAELRETLVAFMDDHVYPREAELARAVDEDTAPGVPYPRPMVELRERAKAAGLWNLWMPASLRPDPGLTNAEYGLLCEVMGRSGVAPAVFNCNFPDTGNMEVLAEYGTREQQERWLEPLLEGEIRSAFALTEPEHGSSDPTQIACRARREGHEWAIDGRKWFSTGVNGAAVIVLMAVTEPEAEPHKRASMILVPIDAPGLNLVRPISFMGHTGGPGHWELRFEDCRVPFESTLGEPGEGFAIAQARLGPGRIHHCMRAIGGAERALEMMCRRANERVTFGGPLADKQMVQDFVARSRIEIDAARLLCLHAAWKIDTVGKRAARQEIAEIKVLAAQVYMDVLDRAIQVHGALGVSDDTPLARMWREGRALRLGDGPDEVHKMTIARRELARWRAQPAS